MATKDTNPSSSRSGDAITPGEWVRYDQLERKETRLRPDQYNSLSELSRGLNRQRHGRGERITENTLIRVAIDLLLSEKQSWPAPPKPNCARHSGSKRSRLPTLTRASLAQHIQTL